MANEQILALLKYAAPVVALLSAIWSTTQKLTYEDSAGAKRLTLPGRIMIGFNVTAAAISLLAIGFDSLVRQQQADAAAAQKTSDRRSAAEEKRREREEVASQRQAEALARIEADAKEQNRFLEQRFLIVSNAAAQQRRDAAVSLELARQSSQRLTEAERALAEFERVNYPLRALEASAALDLNFEGVDIEPLWAELQRRDDFESWPAVRGGDREDGKIVTFHPAQVGLYPPLSYATLGTHVTLGFLPAEAAESLGGSTGRRSIEPLGPADRERRGILWVDLPLSKVVANTKTRTMTVYFAGAYRPETEGAAPGGEKLSLSDIGRLVPVLTIRRGEPAEADRRPPDRLQDVSYSLNGFRRFSGSLEETSIVDTTAYRLTPDESPR